MKEVLGCLLRDAQGLAILNHRPLLQMGLDAAVGYVCRLRGDGAGVEAAGKRLRELSMQYEALRSPEYRQALADLQPFLDDPGGVMVAYSPIG